MTLKRSTQTIGKTMTTKNQSFDYEKGFTLFQHYLFKVKNLSENTVGMYSRIWRDRDNLKKDYQKQMLPNVLSHWKNYHSWMEENNLLWMEEDSIGETSASAGDTVQDEEQVIHIKTKDGDFFMDYSIESLKKIGLSLSQMNIVSFQILKRFPIQ